VGDGTPSGGALGALIRELGVDVAGAGLTGTARLPARAGLGSSAAVATAVARALVSFHGIDLDDDRLFAAVQAAERVFHGNPSGLDATVAIGGGVIRFDRASGAEPLDTEAPALVVIHSGANGHTRQTVAEFGRRLEDQPGEGRRRLARISELVEQGIVALGLGDLQTLGRTMDENQGQLSWFGVSTADLDRICEIARSAGALGAKLTGGGGGGCAVALVRPADRDQVVSAVETAGYEVVWR
jgi:mevalonate kinase